MWWLLDSLSILTDQIEPGRPAVFLHRRCRRAVHGGCSCAHRGRVVKPSSATALLPSAATAGRGIPCVHQGTRLGVTIAAFHAAWANGRPGADSTMPGWTGSPAALRKLWRRALLRHLEKCWRLVTEVTGPEGRTRKTREVKRGPRIRPRSGASLVIQPDSSSRGMPIVAPIR